MATFKERLPQKGEWFATFSACAFFIHVWAIIAILIEVPSLLIRISVGDVVGAVAYSLVFALFESLVVFAFLLALAVLLPKAALAGSIIVKVAVLTPLSIFFAFLYGGVDSFLSFVLWLFSYGALLGIAHLILQRFPRLAGIIKDLVERLTVLVGLYIVVDVVSLIIVIVRNLF